MIRSLLGFGMKRQLARTALFALTAALLSAAAAALYEEGFVSGLSRLRARLPFLSALLGLGGSATPALHLVSLLHGFLLPLLAFLHLVPLGSRLVAGLVGTGEMADLLAAPHRRAAVAMTQFAVLVAGAAAVALSAGLGAAGLWAALRPGAQDMFSLARLFLAFFLMQAMTAGAVFLVSCAANTCASAKRGSAILIAVFFALSLLSRTGGALRWLSYASPFSLFDPQGAAMGETEALRLALLMPASGLAMAGAGALLFTRRDLPL